MANLSLKHRRCKALSGNGPYHRTFDACWEAIPLALKERLTSRELAIVVDAIDAAHCRGKGAAEEEAVVQGYVWDRRISKMRGVGDPLPDVSPVGRIGILPCVEQAISRNHGAAQ